MFKSTSAFVVVLVCSLFAAIPVASAQSGTIVVNEPCIEQGGTFTGSFTGAPGQAVAVTADRNPGADWALLGGGMVDPDDVDEDGNGTFSQLMQDRPDLPDAVWVKARHPDSSSPSGWTVFAQTEDAVPICGRESDPDTDGDGVVDSVDNCDNDRNPGQENNDVDALGDACDADDDNDGVGDGSDNCQFTANSAQRDDDGDGIGNACDGTFDSNDGKSSGGGWLTTSDGKVNFSSSAKSVDGKMAGNCVVTVGDTRIKCLTVDGYHQSATNDRAVFVGTAEQNGVTTRYRIELTDNGESGTTDRIEITTDAGFAAAGVLGSGNLQVHRGV